MTRPLATAMLAALLLAGCGGAALPALGTVRIITPRGVYERGGLGLYGNRQWTSERVTFAADGVTTATVDRQRFTVEKAPTVQGINGMWAGAAALASAAAGWMAKGRR